MLTEKEIKEFAIAFNKYAKDKLPPIIIKTSKKNVLDQLEQRFAELGGLSFELVKEIDQYTKPLGPEKETEWLSNFDIENVMKWYEQKYPDFKFYGAIPLDCEDYNFCPLRRFTNDKSKIGVIYNLDRYGQSGSHWVSLFADLEKCVVYFSDSAGKPPKPDIMRFVERITKYCDNMTFKYNTKKYQTDNTECGVYSINFILRLLKGDSYEDIIKTAPNFKEINSCRNVYFANQPSRHITNYQCD